MSNICSLCPATEALKKQLRSKRRRSLPTKRIDGAAAGSLCRNHGLHRECPAAHQVQFNAGKLSHQVLEPFEFHIEDFPDIAWVSDDEGESVVGDDGDMGYLAAHLGMADADAAAFRRSLSIREELSTVKCAMSQASYFARLCTHRECEQLRPLNLSLPTRSIFGRINDAPQECMFA